MIKFVTFIISLLLTFSYSIVFVQYFTFDLYNLQIIYFITGFIIFIPIWTFWLKKNELFSTIEHEITHIIVGIFFFIKPIGLSANQGQGGEARFHRNVDKNFLVLLAPYFLPTLSIFILPLYFIIKTEYLPCFFILFGFTIAYHVLSTKQEIGFHQTDIIKSGKIFSIVFLIFTNIFFYCFIFLFVTQDFEIGLSYIKEGFMLPINKAIEYLYFLYN